MSINVSSLSLFENFNGTTGRDGFPGKRQKLVPGQTFGKEREIAVTNGVRTFFCIDFKIAFQDYKPLKLQKEESIISYLKVGLGFGIMYAWLLQ